jgi:hypothetical protein
MVQNNLKTVFNAVFGHFGANWAPSNGPKKGIQRMFGAMCKFKNKPLTKIRSILLEEMLQNN